MRPDLSRVPVFYHNYISQVKQDELEEAFRAGTADFLQFLKSIPRSKYDYRYAEGKWTIKEVLQHIIDGERVFAYRALRFARKDTTPLPGFDENTFAENAKTDKRKWNDLVDEFKAVRDSSERLFASFDEDQLDAAGTANSNPVYVLGIGFIIVGHALHHMKIIKERYL
ncbi:MAG TPA: DinB family protein [Chitinophagaceae bacterium]|nr:DinB family protein [Chitinophagaceae bacterium]